MPNSLQHKLDRKGPSGSLRLVNSKWLNILVRLTNQVGPLPGLKVDLKKSIFRRSPVLSPRRHKFVKPFVAKDGLKRTFRIIKPGQFQ